MLMNLNIIAIRLELKQNSKQKAPAGSAEAFDRILPSFLERQRERNTVSPVARAVTIPVSITVVVTQTVRVGENAEIVADLIPIVRDVPVKSRTIHRIFDLRSDIENAACFIATAIQVAAVTVLVGKIVRSAGEPIGKLLEVAGVVVPTVPTIVVSIVNAIKPALEVARSILQILNRSADIPVVSVVAVVIVIVAIVAAIVVVIAIVAVTSLRRGERGQGQNYECQCKNRSYFCKSFHLISPGNITYWPTL
jgi:hypothetical protein